MLTKYDIYQNEVPISHLIPPQNKRKMTQVLMRGQGKSHWAWVVVTSPEASGSVFWKLYCGLSGAGRDPWAAWGRLLAATITSASCPTTLISGRGSSQAL